MSDRIDKIHEVLLQQNKDANAFQMKVMETLNTLQNQVDRVEDQTTKTNGRVTALESKFILIEDKDKKQVIVGMVNKKWVASIFATIGLVWSIVSVLVYAWIEKKFFK